MQRLKIGLVVMILALLVLTGCGTTRTYKSETAQVIQSTHDGNIDIALALMEENNSGEEKDLLYYMEKGQLLQLKNQLLPSTTTWLSADSKICVWEDEVKKDPDKVLGNIASYIVNDKARVYEGTDFEKVTLSSMLAMNHVLVGNWSAARVEIKKTHEREAVIAEFRSKEIAKMESDRQEKGVATTYKDLKGYPVETLDDPDVVNLKNGYQNAFSHYFAGYVYEALGEPSLAAPGYRTAIELQPNVEILEAGLSGLDSRRKQIKPSEADVLFIVSSGMIPSRQSMQIPFPIPTGRGIGAVAVSFPVIRSDRGLFRPGAIQTGSQIMPVTTVTSFDAMARRALRDEMPGIVLRTSIRAATKAAAQVAADQVAKRAGGKYAGIASLAVKLGSAAASAAFEQADERSWRTMPAYIGIVRTTLPKGKHTVSVQTPLGLKQFEVTINDRYAIIPIRVTNSSVYVAQGSAAMDPLMFEKEEVPSKEEAPAVVSKTDPAPDQAVPGK